MTGLSKPGPIIDKCIGCNHTVTGPERGVTTCTDYLIPASKWRIGNCPRATHIQKQSIKEKFEDPLKKAKRLSKVKK